MEARVNARVCPRRSISEARQGSSAPQVTTGSTGRARDSCSRARLCPPCARYTPSTARPAPGPAPSPRRDLPPTGGSVRGGVVLGAHPRRKLVAVRLHQSAQRRGLYHVHPAAHKRLERPRPAHDVAREQRSEVQTDGSGNTARTALRLGLISVTLTVHAASTAASCRPC